MEPEPVVPIQREESRLISTQSLIIAIVFLLILGGGVSVLYDLQEKDKGTFQVLHRGEIPVVINDEQAVSESLMKMMPLMPSGTSTLVTYVEADESCNSAYSGLCTNVRSGPGVEFPSVLKLRKNVVLRVEKKIRVQNRDWYKITFDEFVRYPDRIGPDLYVAGDAVNSFQMEGLQDLTRSTKINTKKNIIVDLSEQTLYAFDGTELFMQTHVSTGLDSMPTPQGSFRIFRKMPSRYMQGPIPGVTNDEYDLPGVPWTMYFTHDGAAIHGAYWHDEFGAQHSHGCINLLPDEARKLYAWTDVGTAVTVTP